MKRPRPKLIGFAALVWGALSATVATGCGTKQPATREAPKLVLAAGNPAEGARLVERFECKRCHSDLKTAEIPIQKDCSGCHRSIATGKAIADPESLNEWQQHVRHLVELPRLSELAPKLRHGWVERFLQQPHDVRPALEETMPRLRLSPEQARDIASYLAPHDAAGDGKPRGVAERGRTLLDERGCGTCHRVSGAPPLKASPIPAPVDPGRLAMAIRLAPDLAQARERLLPGFIEKWLKRPSALSPNSLMPDIPLRDAEIDDISAYLSTLRAKPPLPLRFERLPLLERKVLFSEVQARVLKKTCRHCHADSDYALGDGGPGNSGGFGFAGRRIDLAEQEGLLAGYVDDSGERKSLLAIEPPHGQSRLLEALLARHREEAGEPVGTVRGMPLGLPALPAEDIQLVETWLSQARAR